MKTLVLENVVDFSELCSFAATECGVGYNQAHDILDKDAYPSPESDTREVYLSELKNYAQLFKPGAVEILTKFMEMNNTNFITVLKA